MVTLETFFDQFHENNKISYFDYSCRKLFEMWALYHCARQKMFSYLANQTLLE
jgi:hypothetical protein